MADAFDREQTLTSGSQERSAPGVSVSSTAPFQIGTRIDDFVIDELIGAGGMGAVYLATDIKLDRQVAIKVHRECTTRALERFEREAIVLAKLSHRNIVAVHEVGAHDNGLFLVMEYIDGGTARQWLAAEERSWRDIVNLFIEAGAGLAAAHEAGVVHRDFKPDNVLVGSGGRVCVADFGIAQLAAEREEASQGAGFGTPSYMAPEQRRGDTAGAAADQFAFCVSLYEALYGELPGTTASVPKTLRAPIRVRRAILKGLGAEASDRHRSMVELLHELRNPFTTHKRFAAGLGTMLIAASIAWPVLDQRARACTGAPAALAQVWGPSKKAEISRAFSSTNVGYAVTLGERLTTRLERYGQQWSKMYVSACEATHVTQEQSLALLDIRMGCLSRRLQSLGATANALATLNEKSLDKGSQLVTNLEPIRSCGALDRLLQNSTPELRRLRSRHRTTIERLEGSLEEAKVQMLMEEVEHAERLITSVQTTARELGHSLLVAEAALQRAKLAIRKGDVDKAIELGFEAAGLAARGNHAEVRAIVWARLVNWIGYQKHHVDEGLLLARVAQTSLEAISGPSRAEMILEDSVAAVHLRNHNYRVAKAHLLRSLEIRLALYGADHPHVCSVYNNLGILARRSGNLREARDHLLAALEIRSKTLTPEHPRVAPHHVNLANTLADLGELESAEKHALMALRIRKATLPDHHQQLGRAWLTVGYVLRKQGRWSEALEAYELSREIIAKVHDEAHPSAVEALLGVGLARAALGQTNRSIADLRECLRLYSFGSSKTDPDVVVAKIELAKSLLEAGARRMAFQELAETLELGRTVFKGKHPDWPRILIRGAEMYLAAKQNESAIDLAREAERASRGSENATTRARVRSFLEEHGRP